MDWHELWEQVLQVLILLQVWAVCTLAVGYFGVGQRHQDTDLWGLLNDRLLDPFHCFMSTALLSHKGKDFFFLLPWKNSSTSI